MPISVYLITLKACGFKSGNLLLERIHGLKSNASSELNLSCYLLPFVLSSTREVKTKATAGKIIRASAEPLRKVNPNVRDEEIQFFAEQWKTLDLVLEAASPRLDAVRIIITT